MDCKYCGQTGLDPHNLHLCPTVTTKLATLGATQPPPPGPSVNCFVCHEDPGVGIKINADIYLCKDCVMDFAWNTELGMSNRWNAEGGTQSWSTRIVTAICGLDCMHYDEPGLVIVLDLSAQYDYSHRFRDLHVACLQELCHPTLVELSPWKIAS